MPTDKDILLFQVDDAIQNKLVLNPANPKYEPLVYVNDELNEIRILGKAVYFMSAL